jgi:hypothetical protein
MVSVIDTIIVYKWLLQATSIKCELSGSHVLAELRRRLRARLKAVRPSDNRVRIAKLEREVESVAEAIATAALRTSPAVATRLAGAEQALARYRTQPKPRHVDQLLPDLAKGWLAMLNDLQMTLMKDPRRSRIEIAEYIGPIPVRTTSEETVLEVHKGTSSR